MSAVEPGLGVFKAPKGSEQILMNRGRQLNARSVPPMPPSIAKLSKDTQVYIFNVGPWQHTQYMGSLGRKIVPACPEGQKHSKPLIIPGIVSELYPDSESSMKRIDSEGHDVAMQIIGVGAHMAPSNALTRYGVAVCRQWPPTKTEIDFAWKALVEGELEGLIQEANSAAARGPAAVEQTINERHYQAARLLKKSAADCPWMNRSVETRERVECKFCGEPMKTGIPRCPNCKEIVDQVLYDSLTAKK